MPFSALGKFVGILWMLATLAIAAGKGEMVWKSIGWMRYQALNGLKVDWGCPATSTCKFYDPEQYRNKLEINP